MYELKSNGKFGFAYLPLKTIVEPKYDRVYRFSQTTVKVRKFDKFGLLTNQGRVIVEPNYISIQRVNDFLIGVKRYDKWALVDFSGKQITQPIYTSLTDILKEGWRANDFADKELEIQEAKELNKVE